MKEIQQKAIAGETVTLTADGPSTWEIPNRDGQSGNTATVKYDSAGERIITVRPEPYTIRLVVEERPIIIPPVQSGGSDAEVKATDDLNATLDKIGPGKPDNLRNVRFADGTYTQPLRARQSYVKYYSATGNAKIVAESGIILSDGIKHVIFENLKCYGRKGSSSPGITGTEGTVKRLESLAWLSCVFDGFESGVLIQNQNQTGPIDDYNRDLKFIDTRLLNSTGTGDKQGHGLFIANTIDLLLDHLFVSKAGFNKKGKRGPYVHGAYLQAGQPGVVVRECWFDDTEGCGLQARGPRWDRKDGSKWPGNGPKLLRSLFTNAGIGAILNGPDADAIDNTFIPVGQYTWGGDSGFRSLMVHAGRGTVSGNTRYSAPQTTTGKLQDHVDISSRAVKGEDPAWPWDASTDGVARSNNPDYFGRKVSYTDIRDAVAAGTMGIAQGRQAVLARTLVAK